MAVVSERQGSDASSLTLVCILLPGGSHALLQLCWLGVKCHRNSDKDRVGALN